MKTLSRTLLHGLIGFLLCLAHTVASAQTVLPPNAVDDALTTDPGRALTIPVLANDSDPENLPLKVVGITAPGNGTARFTDSTVIYTPSFGYSGIDTFQYTISNGVLTNSAFVDAIVLPPPDVIWENDPFDPLNVGDLAGQAGWTVANGSASPLVINDALPNKSVRIDAAPGLPINVIKDVADQTGGRHSFTFRVRIEGAPHAPCEAAIEIKTDFINGWNNKFRFCLGPSITINYNASGAETTLVATTVPGQWYLIHTEINLNAEQVDVYVDGALKVNGLAVNTGPIRAVGITGEDPGGAGAVVVDNLSGVTANGITAGGGCGSGSGTPGMPNYWTGLGDSLWSNANNWSARRVPTATDHAIITLGGTYTVIVNSPVTVGSLTLGAGSGVQTLWVRNTTLTVDNDIRNSGIIRLQSTVNTSSNLVIRNGLLTNNRIINVGVGGFPGTITGQVCNRCRVEVHQNLTFIGTFFNRSIVAIDTTRRMSLSGGAQIFNQNGGEITGKGVLALSSSATMNFNRGATTGPNPPLLTSSKLNFGPSATGAATFIMDTSGELRGDLGAEQTVWIRNTPTAIIAPNGFTNAGAIRFQTTVNTSSGLTIANGALTNTGVINVNNVAFGGFITGALVNRGAVNVSGANLTFDGTFSNFNSLTIDSTRIMTLSGATDVFNQNAGTIAGRGMLKLESGATMNFNSGATTGASPVLTSSKLNFVSPATGVATFIMDTSGELRGDLGAEQTVWIRNTPTAIIAPNGFTNAGAIRFQTTVNTISALTIANGILTNTGVINVNNVAFGSTITGSLVNQGAFNVSGANVTFNGSFTNRGALMIESGRSLIARGTLFLNDTTGLIQGKGILDVSGVSGRLLTNRGEIRPGASPGILTITGNCKQTATASLDIEIGGPIAGTNFDRLAITGSGAGADTLDGALNLSLLDMFIPAVNDSFQILTYGSRSGAFAAVNGRDLGNGKYFKVIYYPNHVTLKVAPEEAIAGLVATSSGPTPWDSVTTFNAAVSAGSNVDYVWSFGDGASASGATVSHIYAAPGTYTVIVTASNTLGAVSDTTTVTVFVVPISGLNATNTSPTPVDSVTILTASVAAGSRVIFTWNFGDGTPPANGAVVNHIYRVAGVYAAIVTATNAVSAFMDTTTVTIIPVSAVDEFESATPSAFVLRQNYPNPFNPSTMISFALPEAAQVKLLIYSMQGRLVRTLIAAEMNAGAHNAVWNARDEHGQEVASGVYLCVLRTGAFTAQRKLLLMK